jgi:hypothetical protein
MRLSNEVSSSDARYNLKSATFCYVIPYILVEAYEKHTAFVFIAIGLRNSNLNYKKVI